MSLPAKTLKKITKSLLAIVTEAKFRFEEDKIQVVAADPANVAMIILNVPHTSTNIKPTSIGVDVDRLHELVKNANNDDIVEMTISNEKIIVDIDHIKYSLLTIDPNTLRRPPKIPQLDLTAHAKMRANVFKRAIAIADKINDVAILESNEDGLTIYSRGDIDEVKITLDELIDYNGETARALYSIDYLKSFLAPMDSKDTLEVRFSTNYPIELKFTTEDDTTMTYYLAPRLDDR